MYQLELSVGSAGKWGAMSEDWSAETGDLTAGTAEWDAGTPKVTTWSSKAEGRTLLWGEARARDAPGLSEAGGFPLLLS
jgi:hypothetical protein